MSYKPSRMSEYDFEENEFSASSIMPPPRGNSISVSGCNSMLDHMGDPGSIMGPPSADYPASNSPRNPLSRSNSPDSFKRELHDGEGKEDVLAPVNERSESKEDYRAVVDERIHKRHVDNVMRDMKHESAKEKIPVLVDPPNRHREKEDRKWTPLKAVEKQMVYGQVIKKEEVLAVMDQETGSYHDRWIEVCPDRRTLSFWKNKASRAADPLAVLDLGDVTSLEWNKKDVERGRRKSLLGGGVRFTITFQDSGKVDCKALNPLHARSWLECLQELTVPESMKSLTGLSSVSLVDEASPESDERFRRLSEVGKYKAPPAQEKHSGSLQRQGRHGYKDRWCVLDPDACTFTYWSKADRAAGEDLGQPKGVVHAAEVWKVDWNQKDLENGRRRSLLNKDGIRFSINFRNGKEPENWRANNPFEAYKWKDLLQQMVDSAKHGDH